MTASMATGWDNGLCQDYNRKLGQWFASRLGARQQLRNNMNLSFQPPEQDDPRDHAPIAGLALMQQLVSDKIDLQKRLDASLAENKRLSALCDKWNSECDDMREDNKRLAGELDALKKQEPAAWIEAFPFGPGNKGIYGWSEYPIGTKFYLSAGAYPDIAT